MCVFKRYASSQEPRVVGLFVQNSFFREELAHLFRMFVSELFVSGIVITNVLQLLTDIVHLFSKLLMVFFTLQSGLLDRSLLVFSYDNSRVRMRRGRMFTPM